MSMKNQPCRLLDWDTTFFGFRIGQVNDDTLTFELVKKIDSWSYVNKINCLYFLSRADDPETTELAEKYNFHLVDIRLTFSVAGNLSLRVARTNINIRPALLTDVDTLQAIAEGNYHSTRFFFDKRFPRYLSTLLYQKWVIQSCSGYADTVLVAELGSEPVGYISCHIDQESRAGKIGLVGVSQHVQGQGIGQKLVFEALSWFKKQGIQDVCVVTQGRNYAAQRLYQKCGFMTQSLQLWYHKWYSSLEGANDSVPHSV